MTAGWPSSRPAIAFLSSAAIFIPMARSGRLLGRRLLLGGGFYIVYLAIVGAVAAGRLLGVRRARPDLGDLGPPQAACYPRLTVRSPSGALRRSLARVPPTRAGASAC